MEVREASATYRGLHVPTDDTVPLGYKQTEAGLIPEEWQVRKLKQISPSQSVGLVINPSTYYASDGTVPMLVGSNVKANRIDGESARRISDASNRLISASQLTAGDLVTVRVGEPGITAVVPPELDGCNCASMMIVRKSAAFDSSWLCYVMNSWLGLGQVEHVQYGTAQKQFNISDAVDFAYPFPSLLEQEAIAKALSDADALIESLEHLITKKRRIKQGTMQALLTGRERLEGYNMAWLERRLGDAASLKARIGWQGLTTKEYLDSGDYYLVTGTDFKDGYIDWSGCHYVDEARYRQDRYIQLESADVLVTKDGTIGKVALVDAPDKPATLNSGIFVIRPIDCAFNPEFFYYLLCSRQFKAFLDRLSAGSTINHLYQKDFVGFIFKAPRTIEEQAAIATILRDMDAELAELETRLAKTRQLKQGMMQELLTGRIRLV